MLSQELRSQVQYVDVLVIGAGPAGMAAAIAAREAGVEKPAGFGTRKRHGRHSAPVHP